MSDIRFIAQLAIDDIGESLNKDDLPHGHAVVTIYCVLFFTTRQYIYRKRKATIFFLKLLSSPPKAYRMSAWLSLKESVDVGHVAIHFFFIIYYFTPFCLAVVAAWMPSRSSTFKTRTQRVVFSGRNEMKRYFFLSLSWLLVLRFAEIDVRNKKDTCAEPFKPAKPHLVGLMDRVGRSGRGVSDRFLFESCGRVCQWINNDSCEKCL